MEKYMKSQLTPRKADLTLLVKYNVFKTNFILFFFYFLVIFIFISNKHREKLVKQLSARLTNVITKLYAKEQTNKKKTKNSKKLCKNNGNINITKKKNKNTTNSLI